MNGSAYVEPDRDAATCAHDFPSATATGNPNVGFGTATLLLRPRARGQ
jgi:hypothetical protein